MGRLLLCVSVTLALWAVSALSVSVFSRGPEAHMLLRSKRANSFLEELKPPSQERECNEEKCDFEEAKEIFKTREATMEFWTLYTDENQCNPNPCVNGACVDLFQDYNCHCHPGFEGKTCNLRVTFTNCSIDNGGCDHECKVSEDGLGRTCSCVKGYHLHTNSRGCIPIDDKSCGQLLIRKSSYSKPLMGLQPWVVGGEVGKKGESPWQVLVSNANGKFHCGGVLIDQNWVLTAAHCTVSSFRFSVTLGEYERKKQEASEVTLPVSQFFAHPHYNSETYDNDIALLRLSSPVPFSDYILPACLPGRTMAEHVLHLNNTPTVVTGWGKKRHNARHYSSALNFVRLPLVEHDLCSRQMTTNVTENMLCAGVLGKSQDACQGDSGGPMVTMFRDTWFLIGLVSWGEKGCGNITKFGVYTKVSNYMEWIESVQEGWDKAQP